jgi:hypothetical protein
MQPDCPVHDIFYFPLIITPPELYPNKPTSELERSYEKYGYVITKENMHIGHWTKNDDSDITSFIQSNAIARLLNAGIQNKIKLSTVNNFRRYNSETGTIKDPTTEYFPNLLTMLKHDAEIVKVNTV